MPDRIVVVTALILHEVDSKPLMALRLPTMTPPDRWELPGGKVDPEETERMALVREVREELGVQCRVGHLVSVSSFNWDTRLLMLLYRCYIVGTPKPLASQRLQWVDMVYARKKLAMMPSQYIWYPDIMEEIAHAKETNTWLTDQKSKFHAGD